MHTQIFKGSIKTIGSSVSSFGNSAANSLVSIGYIELTDGTMIKNIFVPGFILSDKLSNACNSDGEVELHVAWSNKKQKKGVLLAIRMSDGKLFVPDLAGIKPMVYLKRIQAVILGVLGLPLTLAFIGVPMLILAWFFWGEAERMSFWSAYLRNFPDAIVC